MALHCASGQVTWTLPAELNIYRAGELKTELQAALAYGLPLHCALGAVEDLDSSGLQLLLVAKRECTRADLPFTIASNSPVSEEALRVLGLQADTLHSLHPTDDLSGDDGVAQ